MLTDLNDECVRNAEIAVMRSVGVLIMSLGLALCAHAAPVAVLATQNDARKAQIAAAEAEAVESLIKDIAATRLSPEFTIGTYMDRVGGRSTLEQAVKKAS